MVLDQYLQGNISCFMLHELEKSESITFKHIYYILSTTVNIILICKYILLLICLARMEFSEQYPIEGKAYFKQNISMIQSNMFIDVIITSFQKRAILCIGITRYLWLCHKVLKCITHIQTYHFLCLQRAVLFS